MKTKFKVLIFVALLCIASCSKENYDSTEEAETLTVDIQEDALVLEITNTNNISKEANIPTSDLDTKTESDKKAGTVAKSMSPFGPPQGGGCEDWSAPWWTGPIAHYRYLDVYYDSNVPLNEINCVRQSLFEQNPGIFLYYKDPGNPYHDVWYVEYVFVGNGDGTTGGTFRSDAEDDVRNDNRACARNPCD